QHAPNFLQNTLLRVKICRERKAIRANPCLPPPAGRRVMVDLSKVWKPPVDANGHIDWTKVDETLPPRDPELGFHLNWQEKVEWEQSRVKLMEQHARAEEAKTKRERMRRGLPA